MKRKISLMLAAIMALSVVVMPATEVQASSTNRLNGIPGTMVPANSLFVETDFGGYQLPGNVGSVDTTAPGNRGVAPYAIRAGYLELELRSTVNAGATFRLDLENAEWMFNSVANFAPAATTAGAFALNNLVPATPPARPAHLERLNTVLTTGNNINTWGISAWQPPLGVVAGDVGLHRIGSQGIHRTVGATSPVPVIQSTYDLELGVFIPRTAGNHGTYVRAFDPTVQTPAMPVAPAAGSEIPYLLDVSLTNQRIATVTLLETGVRDQVIRIPLVIRVLANDDIRINVVTQGHTAFVTPGSFQIITAGGVATNAHVVDPVTARDRFEIERLVIREVRANSIRRTGARAGYHADANAFDLVLSPGFYFANNLQDVRVGFEYGLQWRGRTQTLPNNDILTWEQGPGFGNALDRASTVGAGPSSSAASDFDVFFPGNDRSILRVRLQHFIESQAIAGVLFIDGLVVWADEDAPFDQDIEISLRNTDEISAVGNNFLVDGTFRNNVNMVTPQTIRAGTRADWNILLRVEGNVPQLISGRYESATAVAHPYHQTARIVFEEVVPNSWWAGRQVILTLPEEVRWRRVRIEGAYRIAANQMAANNIFVNIDAPAGGAVLAGTGANSVWAVAGRNTAASVNGVRFDQNRMYWTDVLARRDDVGPGQRNARALIRFDAWVSIAAHFEGPITLTATGSAVSDCVVDNLPYVVIANAIPPVRVTTEVTDTRIGFQYQQTTDIIITETVPGALIRDRNVRVSVTDFLASDVLFSPTTQIELTEANGMRIGNIGTGLAGNLWLGAGQNPTLGLGAGGTLSFDVLARSHGEPAEITISNVSVRLDRTVPETNDRPYSVVVWGSAIARNFGTVQSMAAALNIDWPESQQTNNDRFANYPGIITDYIRVVTGGDGSPWLTQEVRVTIGELHYTVNGEPFTMDVAALLDPASDSTFVPLRFVANAFNLRDNSGIVWDASARSATLVMPNGRVVQFTDGSTIMLDNGVPRNIVNANGMPIAPMMVPSGDGYVRMFLPFRFLGEEVLGVEVAWEAATQTAIFNPGGDVREGGLFLQN